MNVVVVLFNANEDWLDICCEVTPTTDNTIWLLHLIQNFNP